MPSATILVMHDDHLDSVSALMVTKKGFDEEARSWIMNRMEETGRLGDIAIKTDQEEAIMALKRSIAVSRSGKTALIESQVRVSRSNPRIERSVRTWREQFRKLKLQLESRTKTRTPLKHPMIPWMTEWAGNVTYK